MNILERTLREVCGSEERFRVLRALFNRSSEALRLRTLAQEAGVDPSNASRLLGRLVEAGICERRVDDGIIRYGARADNPLFGQLTELFNRSSALHQALQARARSLVGAQAVLIHGSFARGDDTPESDIDVFVIGDLSTVDALAHFRAISRTFGRKVDVTVETREAIVDALLEGRQFEHEVFSGTTIVLSGSLPDAITAAVRRFGLEGVSRATKRSGNDRKPAGRRHRLA